MSPVEIPGLAVVVPCHQEVQRLEGAVAGFRTLQRLVKGPATLVLVENGSTDGTGALADSIAKDQPDIQVLHLPSAGKGRAVQAGLLATEAPWVLLADADWSMSPEEAAGLLEPSLSSPVRIACREHPASRRVGESAGRHFLGRVFNRWIQLLVLPGIKDTQCGFKAMEGGLARRLAGRLTEPGWAFDVELLALARQAGHEPLAVPLTWRHDEDSRIRPLRDAFAMGLAVLKLAWRFRMSS
jgi:glycosyltransferase involved in cell wall biosynthesis